MSFYVYIGPLIPFITGVYLLPLLFTDRKQFGLVASYLLLVYLLLITPGLIQTLITGDDIFLKTIQREFDSNRQIVVNVYRNFLLFYKDFDYYHNHFIGGPYLDIVSRMFVPAGLIYLILKIKERANWLVLLSFVMTAVMIGVTSPYDYTPVTRGIFLIPFGYVFVGMVLNLFKKYIRWWGIAIVFAGSLAHNIYLSQYQVFAQEGHHVYAYIIKEMQIQNKTERSKSVIFSHSDVNKYYDVNKIELMRHAYGLASTTVTAASPDALNCVLLENRILLWVGTDHRIKDQLEKLGCSNKIEQRVLEKAYFY